VALGLPRRRKVIIVNVPGLLILLAGFGLLFVVAALFPNARWNPTYAMALAWMGLDVLYRASFAEFHLLDPQQGGHIFYVPLWILGVAAAVAGRVEDVKQRRLRQHAAAIELEQAQRDAPPSPPAGRKPPPVPRTRPAVPDRALARRAARWSVKLEDSFARFTVGEKFYVVEGYPGDYWKRTEPFSLALSEIDSESGERSALPALTATGSFSTGQATGVNGTIFVNAGNRLVRLDRGAREWQTVAEREDGTISGPPLAMKRTVVCAWECSGGRLLVSRTTHAGTSWSDAIAGDNVLRLIGAGPRVYLFAHSGDAGKGERKTTVHEIALDRLKTVRSAPLPFAAGAVAMSEGTLYSAGSQQFRVLPPGPFEENRRRSIDELRGHPGIVKSYAFRDGELLGENDTGERAITTLLCQRAQDLSTMALQPVAGHTVHELMVGSRGVFVTCVDLYQCAIESLDSSAGRLARVTCCPGEPVGAPAAVGDALLWLVQDSSFEDLQQAVAGRAKPVTRYRLLSSDATGNVRSHAFDWGETFEEPAAAGSEVIVLAGRNRAIAVPVSALLLEVEAAPATMPAQSTRGGPRIDLWAYDHPDGFLAGILKNLVQDADRFWEYSPDQRYQILFALRDHWLRSVNQSVPAPGGDNNAAGELSRVFVDAGRLLLFEFIRENKHQVSISARVWPYVHSVFFREVVSWCNRGALANDEVLGELPGLSLKWSNGAAQLFDDWRSYRDLARDLVTCGLLGGRWRDPLEDALRRVWASPRHPMKRDVFISYSHRDLDAARRLAEGLGKCGVAVAFDGWQPEAEADEREVEMWIAENVMSSDRMIYLVSSNALGSGWIRRECEWERRLLGLRDGFDLPLLIGLDSDAVPEGYPADLVFDGRGLRERGDTELMSAIACHFQH
jgi:hypothetical protein